MKAILFDLYGVLIDKMDYEFLQQEMGLPLETYYDRWTKYKIGQINNQQFWQDAARNAENQFLSKHKLNSSFEVLKSIGSKVKLGLCSNVPIEWGKYYVRKFNFDELFSPIILSGECKLKKPNKDIYQLCLEKLNLSPSDVAFVDDLKRNLIPADELGMITIQYRTTDDVYDKKFEDFKPTHTINSFSALENIVD